MNAVIVRPCPCNQTAAVAEAALKVGRAGVESLHIRGGAGGE
jgi:hypothetical protein